MRARAQRQPSRIRNTDYRPVMCAAGPMLSTRAFPRDSTNSTAGSALASEITARPGLASGLGLALAWSGIKRRRRRRAYAQIDHPGVGSPAGGEQPELRQLARRQRSFVPVWVRRGYNGLLDERCR